MARKGYYDGCEPGRELAAQARRLWEKLSKDASNKNASSAKPITSEKISQQKDPNNVSGSIQKRG